MNTSEFLRRLNSDGRAVVFVYDKFKKNFESVKNEANSNNDQNNRGGAGVNERQWQQLDSYVEALGSAVKDLKRSIDVSNDPRYNRR